MMIGVVVVTISLLLAVSDSFTQPPARQSKNLACPQVHVVSRQCSHLWNLQRWSVLPGSSAPEQQVVVEEEEETIAKPPSERIDLVALQQETIRNNPSAVQILSQDPLIFLVPDLLSAEECNAYREYVQKLEQSGRPMTRSNPPQVSLELSKLWPLPFLSLGAGIPPAIKLMQMSESTVGMDISIQDVLQASLPNVVAAWILSAVLAIGVLTLIRTMSNSSSRTSVATALNCQDDIDLIRPLVDRITALTQHAWYQWEAPVVTKYDVGAIFAKHGDASPQQGKEWAELGGQRVVTCICYLNTLLVKEEEGKGGGGETYFDQLNLAVVPKQGHGLFFFPADSVTWKADDRTTHESLPPMQKEKWIVQMFGRAERVPPPLGLPDVFGEKESRQHDL